MQQKSGMRMCRVGFMVICMALYVMSTGLIHAQVMHFIAIGDTPYSAIENEHIKTVVKPAIQASGLPFVVHHGDFKSGGEACTQQLFKQRHDDMYDLLPGRVFYTPGDNEWTDCDRTFLKPSVSELTQLDLLRKIFFSEDMQLPESWHYARQPNFPENARWMYQDVFFMTVHLVSTNNGRINILKDDIEVALALVDARDQANRVWMEESFKLALQADAKAMVIVTQADVTSPKAAGACTVTNRMHCDAFQNFRDQLRWNAANFAKRGQAQRPVLLLHGDTYPYCMDKQFGGKQAPRLWRLNAWGDFQSPADATKVTVQPDNMQIPFKAETLVGHQVARDGCR